MSNFAFICFVKKCKISQKKKCEISRKNENFEIFSAKQINAKKTKNFAFFLRTEFEKCETFSDIFTK